eukprot:2425825-Rhodomonas_salina.2
MGNLVPQTDHCVRKVVATEQEWDRWTQILEEQEHKVAQVLFFLLVPSHPALTCNQASFWHRLHPVLPRRLLSSPLLSPLLSSPLLPLSHLLSLPPSLPLSLLLSSLSSSLLLLNLTDSRSLAALPPGPDQRLV